MVLLGRKRQTYSSAVRRRLRLMLDDEVEMLRTRFHRQKSYF